jgi:trk system potassium uptake protein TrkA
MKVIIVGGGKVGCYLTSLLQSGGHQVKLIEIRTHQLERLACDLPKEVLVWGSGTDPSVLEAATIARLEYQVPRILARIKNPKNAWLFTPEMGVDVALNQAELMATLVAEEMSVGDMMTLLKLNQGQFSLVEEKVHPESLAVGKMVRELELPTECVLVAIIRNGQLSIPHGDTRLLPADEVLAIIHAADLQDLAKILGPVR